MNIALIMITVIVLAMILIYCSMNLLKVYYYPIISTKIPSCFHGFRITQLSDLHLKQFGKNNIKLVEKIKRTHPHCIVITGDMVDKKRKTDAALQLLEKLVEKYPVYYSLGNHELTFPSRELNAYIEELKKIGIVVLENEKITIQRDNQYINLYGMNHCFKMDIKNTKAILQPKYEDIMVQSLGKPNLGEYNILLAHDPLNYPLYDKWGADLVFSGHVHGGIVRVLGKALISPRRTLFPTYFFGRYQGKNGSMIVSNGLGNGKYKIRIFNFPSLQCVVLRSQ